MSATAGLLPPEAIYESREALLRSINAWAAEHGCAFITRRTTKERSGRLTMTCACDRSGRPPDPTRVRQRSTTTKRTDCMYSVTAKQKPDGTWALKHRSDPKFSLHNHEPTPARAHPVHRAFTAADKDLIMAMMKAGVAPKVMFNVLVAQGKQTVLQDVYNFVAKVKRENRCEETPAQQLQNV